MGQAPSTCPNEGGQLVDGSVREKGTQQETLAFLPWPAMWDGCLAPVAGAAALEKAWPWAHPCVPTDGEKLSGVTDGRGVRAALSTQRAEDSSESHEEEQAVIDGRT